MKTLEKKLKLLNFDESFDIEKDDFYFLILKIEEEKIRLYKPKEREKINYRKEKNYIEHIIKYLKKLNINIENINKNNMNDLHVRTYILNNLTTLALIDEYKDITNFDDDDDDEDIQDIENGHNHLQDDEDNDDLLINFFELNYLKLHSNDESQYIKENTFNVLIEKINEIFKHNNIPLLNINNMDRNYINISYVISALKLIKEKLKNKSKTDNTDYEHLFSLNINVKDDELKEFVYIIRYLFNEQLKKRKIDIKEILNDIQTLTYNPVIDIKQGRLGR
ncbi:hypothetical protein PFMG_02024 [Plasmodium falciparum IGH-CR14]|uniref:RNA transcription, translation and transport factor protein, putative n=5 Tax=Plasmodium falciparum TaxID=5833 RepID=Q8IIN8_PLAF7|nr:RNA transcription, translation and transport factor protein, putative [Plasmodium falciparum 3D7]ETW52749.1 hypothetical protein PFUGPA_05056 [Plasmodium falciparum Palo Alto/Uganda]ETW60953.1 hypothetical protein PFMC_03184 [Plasmodium falciparum CAMP/Malaysia]EWC88169.1 hypothetical protein PFNF54_03088 [Plasmodium falciparum NF54]KNG75820.1 hypothetical protein PFMG_02024 [Plasmodium falciparum IGH-CR14]KAF4330849.1 hypothetical protein CYL21_0329 [Plasmodium falciparum NF54]|eukprot:XP_001347803.1 conserved protein, unknown function [Plasmodium falciparum 3D7]